MPIGLLSNGGDASTGLALCSLADHGVRFEWALSAAPSTAPSVASMLTSRYPSQHGVSQYASTILADEQRTVAEELAAAGYDTGAFVSNPVIRGSRNLHQGFAHYDDERTRSEGARGDMIERAARETTDAALAWLAEAREPWFVWLHFQDPHGPYSPPTRGPLPRDAGKRLPLLEDQSGLAGGSSGAHLRIAGSWTTRSRLLRPRSRYPRPSSRRTIRDTC